MVRATVRAAVRATVRPVVRATVRPVEAGSALSPYAATGFGTGLVPTSIPERGRCEDFTDPTTIPEQAGLATNGGTGALVQVCAITALNVLGIHTYPRSVRPSIRPP